MYRKQWIPQTNMVVVRGYDLNYLINIDQQVDKIEFTGYNIFKQLDPENPILHLGANEIVNWPSSSDFSITLYYNNKVLQTIKGQIVIRG